MTGGMIMAMKREDWQRLCEQMAKMGQSYHQPYQPAFDEPYPPYDPSGKPPIDWSALNRDFS